MPYIKRQMYCRDTTINILWKNTFKVIFIILKHSNNIVGQTHTSKLMSSEETGTLLCKYTTTTIS